MSDDGARTVLTPVKRAIARALADEINRFNIQATGVDDFEELLLTQTSDGGRLSRSS